MFIVRGHIVNGIITAPLAGAFGDSKHEERTGQGMAAVSS